MAQVFGPLPDGLAHRRGQVQSIRAPFVATKAEAKATAVPLPTANAPTIDYQDPLDISRGKLTETSAYYTFLDAAHPAHRALIRFSTGEQVAFERVFSWLDVNLKSGTASNFVGSVATNLTTVSNVLNYPIAVSNYSNYLAQLEEAKKE